MNPNSDVAACYASTMPQCREISQPMAVCLKMLLLVCLLGIRIHAAPTINGAVNAATFKVGALAPGTLFSIFGSGFSTATVSASSVPLPTVLSGTSVLVNDRAIPLVFVSAGQINAQLPYGLASGTARLSVRDAAGAVSSINLSIAPSSPGIFTKTSDGKGEAIAVHADYSLVNRAVREYATIGETVVLYCTGFGEVAGFSNAGAPAPSSPLPSAIQSTEVFLNGRSARVVYAGLTPGSVGLYQVNFVVPDEIGGDVDVSVKVGSVTSNVTSMNVAGVFSLAANYSGTLVPRGSTERLQVDFTSLISTNVRGRFTGSYSVSRSSAVLERGTFDFVSTPTIFLIQGRTTAGESLFGEMDTLDAGESFIGAFLSDPQKPDSWYATFQVTKKTPVPPSPSSAPPPGGTFSCAAVEGASIFAADGKYLGKITSNRFDQDSIGNQFGSYGSQYSQTSIFNTYGPYGGDFSSTSAFNQFATSPPIIYLNGRAQWFLTINSTKSPRIAPTQLYPCVGK